MAYVQAKAGYKVKADMPGAEGEALEALYAKGKEWLGQARRQRPS
jgi:hypothetical protein